MSKRIAVVGSGISGLTAAYLLNQKHQVTIFEASEIIGGHTATKNVEWGGAQYAIDTGFIVFNDWTYPKFQKLLHELNVPYKPTEMGFSVSNDATGLEYSGTNLDTMFAQRKNLVSFTHWQMIRDILRFNKQSIIDVESGTLPEGLLLGEYLDQNNYSTSFADNYLIPMGAAIWSASTAGMRAFPLAFFVRFFKNHGLLSVNDRPQWHVIKGGSRAYLEPLIESFRDNIHTNTPIHSIVRKADGVVLSNDKGLNEAFDEVIIASHSDQALAMLSDPSHAEQSVLGRIAYQNNDVVLHTDESLLPHRKKAWSSWNYRIKKEPSDLPVLTYSMNILQGIKAPVEFCVTLNDTKSIDPDKIIGQYTYAHPVFSLDAVNAQAQWADINGVNRTWFCGAYWRNGFHEDGVNSAVRVAKGFGIDF